MLSQRESLALGRRAISALLLRTTFANAAGGLGVWTYMTYVAPLETAEHPSGIDDFYFLVAYVAVVAVVLAPLGFRHFTRTYAWLVEARRPSAEEVRALVHEPARHAFVSFLIWLVAAGYFALVSAEFGHSTAYHVKNAVSIAISGLVAAAVTYLLVERSLRPVFAVALAGDPPERSKTLGVRPRLLLTWALGSGVPLVGIALLPWWARRADSRTDISDAVTVLGLAGLLVGSFATVAAARSLADPLDRIRAGLRRIQDGDLDVQVEVDDAGEVGMLEAGVNQMVVGLRERQRLQELFGRHVGVEVARRALEEGTGLGGEQREASALFVDLVGSTAMAEVLPPAEVVRNLNAFFTAVVDAVSAEGGWVNKFEGDGALCVFGAPSTQPDHAARALRAARVLRAAVDDLARSHPGLDAGIGVSSGVVVAGNVGTERRYEYTVIGRPVNEAARLTELAKARPGRIVASGGSITRAGDEAVNWISVGNAALRGQSQPTDLYEPAAPATVSATGASSTV